jgi:hypothetical protein
LNACRRPLDPLDAEALASAAEPVCASDAAEHARQCPSCAAMVSEAAAFARALDELAGLPARSGTQTPDLAGGIVRLRPFSHRERRNFSLWRGAWATAAALFVSGILLLALPGLTAVEQVSLSAAAFAPVAAILRAAFGSVSEIALAAPSGLEALALVLRGQSALGIAGLLLLVPAAWGFRRAVARERRR